MYNQPNTKLLFYLYARKSSETEDRQVQSIEDQIKELKRIADTKGIVIKEILTESRSAKKPDNRPVFDEMLANIENGNADGILCWAINRLSRNPIDSGKLGWMLQQGVLKSIQTMERQYLPDDNVLLFNVESGMANQFIIDLRKSSRRGMVGKAERGWLPSRAPLGYINDKLENIIKEDPERFELIKKMWMMMLSGNYNPTKILRIANEEWNLRTPKNKKGGFDKLSTSVIYKMFNNIFYTGNFTWCGNLYKGNHRPMITIDEFDKVQIMLGKKGKQRSKTHEFAYTGIIQCSYCGGMITATEKIKYVKMTDEFKRYVYYHCTHKKKNIDCKQQSPITLTELESQIHNELSHFSIIPIFLEWAIKILDEDKIDEIENITKINDMRLKTLAEKKKELEALTAMRYRDLIDDDEFIRNRMDLKNTITKIECQLQEIETENKSDIHLTRETFELATYGHYRLENGSSDEKRKVLASLGQNFALTAKKLIFNKYDWLSPIEEEYPKILAEYNRLELDKTLSPYMRNKQKQLLFTRWGAVVKDVRTKIMQKQVLIKN